METVTGSTNASTVKKPASAEITLYNWYLLNPCVERSPEVAIGGFLTSELNPKDRRESASIIERLDRNKVLARDGMVVILNGPLDDYTTILNGFSFRVTHCFIFGFPYIWSYLLKEWASQKVHSPIMELEMDEAVVKRETGVHTKTSSIYPSEESHLKISIGSEINLKETAPKIQERIMDQLSGKIGDEGQAVTQSKFPGSDGKSQHKRKRKRLVRIMPMKRPRRRVVGKDETRSSELGKALSESMDSLKSSAEDRVEFENGAGIQIVDLTEPEVLVTDEKKVKVPCYSERVIAKDTVSRNQLAQERERDSSPEFVQEVDGALSDVPKRSKRLRGRVAPITQATCASSSKKPGDKTVEKGSLPTPLSDDGHMKDVGNDNDTPKVTKQSEPACSQSKSRCKKRKGRGGMQLMPKKRRSQGRGRSKSDELNRMKPSEREASSKFVACTNLEEPRKSLRTLKQEEIPAQVVITPSSTNKVQKRSVSGLPLIDLEVETLRFGEAKGDPLKKKAVVSLKKTKKVQERSVFGLPIIDLDVDTVRFDEAMGDTSNKKKAKECEPINNARATRSQRKSGVLHDKNLPIGASTVLHNIEKKAEKSPESSPTMSRRIFANRSHDEASPIVYLSQMECKLPRENDGSTRKKLQDSFEKAVLLDKVKGVDITSGASKQSILVEDLEDVGVEEKKSIAQIRRSKILVKEDLKKKKKDALIGVEKTATKHLQDGVEKIIKLTDRRQTSKHALAKKKQSLPPPLPIPQIPGTRRQVTKAFGLKSSQRGRLLIPPLEYWRSQQTLVRRMDGAFVAILEKADKSLKKNRDK